MIIHNAFKKMCSIGVSFVTIIPGPAEGSVVLFQKSERPKYV